MLRPRAQDASQFVSSFVGVERPSALSVRANVLRHRGFDQHALPPRGAALVLLT